MSRLAISMYCICACVCTSVCLIRGIKIPPPASSVTPFSNPLKDNLFVFVGTLYAVFISAEKSAPTFQQSEGHIIIDIKLNHVPGLCCHGKLHTQADTVEKKHPTFTECNTSSATIHCLNIKWCRLKTRIPLHSFQPSCIFAPHSETRGLVLCFIIRVSTEQCCMFCLCLYLSGKSGYHED